MKLYARLKNLTEITHEARVKKHEEREYINAFVEWAKETALEEGTKIDYIKADDAMIWRA